MRRRFRHLARGRRRGTNRQPSGPSRGDRERFRRLFPISPLSTGLITKFFAFRDSAARCMVHQVIGTAVPASPEGRQRQEGCGR